MSQAHDLDRFKFRFVSGGQAQGIRARQGSLGDDALELADARVGYGDIVESTTRGNRLILVLGPAFDPHGELAKNVVEGQAVVIEVYKTSARALELAIDRRCAELEAKAAHAELEAKGLQHLIRGEQCPHCNATVDLSGVAPTPYTYCRFCETIFSADRTHVTSGDSYRVCDECGMFDRIQPYTEFYFYFLLVVYGFRSTQRFLCDSCAHRVFVKALALNALFLLGVPSAVWVKIKSMMGRDPAFTGLSRANELARKGRWQEAAMEYDALLRDLPEHPGILMNQALGHANGGDETGAADLLQRSFAACNHYVPLIRLVAAAQSPEPAQ